MPVDSFTKVPTGLQLFPDERAKAFKPGTPLDSVLAEVRRIVAALPVAQATFSKQEVEQAKSVTRDYFVIAARDREALQRILYGGGDLDEIIGKTPKTTVLTLSFDPQDPARTSALIPDSRRNDFNNVIVLRLIPPAHAGRSEWRHRESGDVQEHPGHTAQGIFQRVLADHRSGMIPA